MTSMPDKSRKNGFLLNFVYLLLVILSSCSGIATKLYYRRYILSNHINDFGLADCLPSFFFVTGIIFFYFLFCKLSGEEISFKTIAFITIGVLTYELVPLSHGRTFDFKDIIATLIGASLAALIYYVLEARTKIEVER
ncbi:MAG: hypothetical protein ACM3Q2_18155 [Syntrophothermus sp.]